MALYEKLPQNQALSLWTKFTFRHPDIVPFSFHPSLFSFYTNHFNWKPYYFLLYKNDELVNLFPLVNTGKKWVSLPHFSYGGELTRMNSQGSLSSLIVDKLVTCVSKENAEPGFYKVNLDEVKENYKGTKSIYIRSLQQSSSKDTSQKTTSLIELPDTSDILFDNLNSNLRRKIRKARDSGIIVQKGGKGLLKDFHKVYSRNVHRLGSPAYGKSFFSDLDNSLSDNHSTFFVARKNGKPIGVAYLLNYQKFFENAWFATEPSARKDYVSDLLHYDMISHAIECCPTHGSERKKIYSFGRSTTNSSVHMYKKHWPVKDLPLYEYHSHPSESIKSRQWLSFLWKLIPYTMAKFLGPKLITHLY